MGFKPTIYKLKNIKTGRVFNDDGWTLTDPESSEPSLIRAVYSQRLFSPKTRETGIYRYADWLPITRTLKRSSAPVTYKSKKLAEKLGLENLYITFSGYWPKMGARMETCSFKETEAFSVCARMKKFKNKVLVVQSAGNTARAFARVCSDNNIPLVVCIPEDCLPDLWFRRSLKSCVKIVATPCGTDYYDAIVLGEKLCRDNLFLAEGGAKNIARRDGMGTTLLSAVEVTGKIPDAYFQAVGSGTGAIAVWENANRLEEDGRFGKNNMRIYACQNSPFTIIYDSWKAGSPEILPIDPDESRHKAECILAKVLSNRKPPYGIPGGLFDVLTASKGDMFKVTNDEIVYAMLQFYNLEGIDILPASAAAVAGLYRAVKEGIVKKDEVIMLNITGGGMIKAGSNGFFHKEADLIISQELDAEEIIAAVKNIL